MGYLLVKGTLILYLSKKSSAANACEMKSDNSIEERVKPPRDTNLR